VQQRYFYMLPVLPALCLLAGHGLATLEVEKPRLATGLCVLQAVLIAGGAAWLFTSQHELPWLLAAVIAALLAGALATRGQGSLALGAVTMAVVLSAASFTRYADGPVLWSMARFHRHGLAAMVAKEVDASQPLFSFGLTPVLYIQVTGRSIPEFQSLAGLEHAMAKRQLRQAYVLALANRESELAQRFEVRELALMPRKANDRAGLFLVTQREQ
jgi:hypothetical protein